MKDFDTSVLRIRVPDFILFHIAVMGKAEGHGENWHGHVTALTVSPDYRRLGLAATLMNFLENVSEKYLFVHHQFNFRFFAVTFKFYGFLFDCLYFEQKNFDEMIKFLRLNYEICLSL